MTELPAVLVIEDDRNVQTIVEEALTDGGFRTIITASGEEAIALLSGDAAIARWSRT